MSLSRCPNQRGLSLTLDESIITNRKFVLAQNTQSEGKNHKTPDFYHFVELDPLHPPPSTEINQNGTAHYRVSTQLDQSNGVMRSKYQN